MMEIMTGLHGRHRPRSCDRSLYKEISNESVDGVLTHDVGNAEECDSQVDELVENLGLAQVALVEHFDCWVDE